MPIWSLDSQPCKVVLPLHCRCSLDSGRQLEPQAGLYLSAHTAHMAQQRPGLRPRCKGTQDSLISSPPCLPLPQGSRVLASLTSFNSAPSWHVSNPAYNSSGVPCGLQRPSPGPSVASKALPPGPCSPLSPLPAHQPHLHSTPAELGTLSCCSHSLSPSYVFAHGAISVSTVLLSPSLDNFCSP